MSFLKGIKSLGEDLKFNVQNKLEDLKLDAEIKASEWGLDDKIYDLKDNISEKVSDLKFEAELKIDEIKEKITDIKGENTEDEKKYVVIECMDEEVKLNYVKAIINFAYLDKNISQNKIAEIYSLMAQINMQTEYRVETRKYMINPNEDLNSILDKMDEKVPCESQRVAHLSLIKDLIRISMITKSQQGESEKAFIESIKNRYRITDDEAYIMQKACENDFKILRGEVNDSEIIKNAKELSAKAAGVGVPIAAVYLSGSVIGLSAPGIATGLAALGLGGVLGLSSMVTGIGVAILIGVSIYKGVRWVTSGGERQKTEKREFLIQQAIRNNQKTINNLVEDINWYANQIVELLKRTDKNQLMISKLASELELFSRALESLQTKGIELDEVLNVE